MFVVSCTQVSTSIWWSSTQNQYQKDPIIMAAVCTAFIHILWVHLFPQFSFHFFSVAVGLFVPFWYWHWLNKVSTPPLLFSPSCNKNIISFIFPRTLNYWLLIAHWKVIRWSFFNQSIFLQDSISSFLFIGPESDHSLTDWLTNCLSNFEHKFWSRFGSWSST